MKDASSFLSCVWDFFFLNKFFIISQKQDIENSLKFRCRNSSNHMPLKFRKGFRQRSECGNIWRRLFKNERCTSLGSLSWPEREKVLRGQNICGEELKFMSKLPLQKQYHILFFDHWSSARFGLGITKSTEQRAAQENQQEKCGTCWTRGRSYVWKQWAD